MPMFQYISKSIVVLSTVLMLGACSGTAQTVDDTPLAEYHGLYTPSNTEDVQETCHTNHPDYDWGLWGHNLKKALGGKVSADMYAVVNGKRDSKQLCFSSGKLYDAVREYIIDQFGYGSDDYCERISIMPMDNKLACTCARCLKKGNTATNATPAVTDFVTRLAKEFPRHRFFTSAYHTTMQAPQTVLPDNVGVFVSSISLPMQVNFRKTNGYKEFLATVKAWQKKCLRIYVWDYERNYDDYLSPFPCLQALQSRLQLYRELGVKGVFLNGSGYDYSAFDDMQTYVLAQMMDNPDLDIHKAVADYFRQYYPVTAALLTDYYWTLEERTRTSNRLLPLYGTMKDMCRSYLDAKEFVRFRSSLDAMSKNTAKDERKRLNALLTALAYTQLEMYRTGILPKDADMAVEMREILKGHNELKGMENRDETGHTIDEYLKRWE